ncbi:Replication initiation factor [compost metagenome]
MKVSTDTKRLKARLNDIQVRLLFDRVIKPYKQRIDLNYYYSVEDKRNGVYLGHIPRASYMNYTTSISFHGYSDDSSLLREIFAVIPLEQWLTSEIHIAFNFNEPYEQFHVVRPAKRADVQLYPTSMYFGGKSSSTRLYIYDKQVQMAEKHHIQTDIWTRVELRYKFSPMKRISKLKVSDFSAADQYYLFTDISILPDNMRS